VAGARYFFRRAVEEDQKLFQGLAFSQLERLGEAQEKGFTALAVAMTQQGQRLEELLGDVRAVVVETHSAVLDLQGQIEGQSGHIQQIGQAVQKLLEQHQLHRREVRPGDSLSIRNDNERQLVKQLVARYRALPEAERRQMPALLNGIGKLEVVAGDFEAARKDFDAVATLVDDNKVQAEAYCNAYQACLERRDWPSAIQELVKVVKLDAKRFAPFPVGKYQPQRILGAGGFGVAFLCKHKYMEAQVVVKTLMLEDLGRDADKVFSEAQLLRQLDHPAIIRISDCGYVDAANKSRPFLVMDYFEGGTLEEHVKKHGALSVDDVLAVARPVAEGLQAAHGKGILHRDVKPANLLIRRGQGVTGASTSGYGLLGETAPGSWQVKVIDFGLALRQKVVRTSMNASTAKLSKTLVGESIAGTMDYAAPEQMGRRDDPSGPYSDVYGWAKTCCFALFQTTQPLPKHWQSLPPALAQLLEKCLDEDPKNRPQSFAEVLEGLQAIHAPVGQRAREPAAKQGFDFQESAAKTTTRKQPRTSRQRRERSMMPLLIGSILALVTVTVVLLFTVVLRSRPQSPDLPIIRQVVYSVSPSVRMVFCWIPAGESRLGSPPSEMKQENHEDEMEHVFSTPGFWLGKYEVTQAEWVTVIGKNPSVHDGGKPGIHSGWSNKATGMDTSRFPVEDISWEDVQQYIKALNARGGVSEAFGTPGRFAVPTEDEWEYACRGGRGNADPFYFGKVLNGRQANCDGKKPYGTAVPGPSLGRPTVVGSYAGEYPHPWGLCDLHGNVWEFCDSDRPRRADTRVLRGGCWGPGEECRAANRNYFGPDTNHYGNLGLRVCFRPG